MVVHRDHIADMHLLLGVNRHPLHTQQQLVRTVRGFHPAAESTSLCRSMSWDSSIFVKPVETFCATSLSSADTRQCCRGIVFIKTV